jgi:hypothetical protein
LSQPIALAGQLSDLKVSGEHTIALAGQLSDLNVSVEPAYCPGRTADLHVSGENAALLHEQENFVFKFITWHILCAMKITLCGYIVSMLKMLSFLF